ncbi:hypothetical protein C9I57_19415 [Trinickia symbiotica]|uniref:Uncharacterized protein n=1 Tax=Trinickia symbiotica TaxID=863227 RepID=A0A2T3XRP5_9BURK|nr:hypothetical protein C9I57_19415 [Trinickia symbiotica]
MDRRAAGSGRTARAFVIDDGFKRSKHQENWIRCVAFTHASIIPYFMATGVSGFVGWSRTTQA